MNLVISKCVTAVKVSKFSGHYLRKRSTLDIGVLGYIGIQIVQHKEHSPEVFHIPPGTFCIINQQDATLAVLRLLTTTSMLSSSQLVAPDTHTHNTGPNFTLPNTDYAHKTSQVIFSEARLILPKDGSQRIRNMSEFLIVF